MPTVIPTHEDAIDRKALFDHLPDPATWSSHYNRVTEVDVPDRLDEPGHRVTLPFRRRFATARRRGHHRRDARVRSMGSRRP